MATHVNDHIPVPVNSAIIMTSEQFNDLQAFLAELHGRNAQHPNAGLSEEQFAEMRRLLQPGFELSALMLADYRAQRSNTGPTTRSIMAEGLPEDEWRTPDEINRGIPLDANRDEVRPNRNERGTDGFEPNPMNPNGESERQRVDRQARAEGLRNPAHQADRQYRGLEPGPQNPAETQADRQGNTQGETERARVERLERESANNRLT